MKHKKRISSSTAGLMYGVAIIFDGISLIPVAGSIVPVFGSLTFWLWFKMKGVDFSGTKKMTAGMGTILIEAIPLFNVVPAWTFSTFLIINVTRAEDAISAKKNELADEKTKEAIVYEQQIQDEEAKVSEEALMANALTKNEPVNETDASNMMSTAEEAPEEEIETPRKYNVVRDIKRIDYTINRHLKNESDFTKNKNI